jgi:hypothetical protein
MIGKSAAIMSDRDWACRRGSRVMGKIAAFILRALRNLTAGQLTARQKIDRLEVRTT